MNGAYTKASALLEKVKAAGATAYKGADYDLAIAHTLQGRMLRLAGQATPALDLLIKAQQQFEALGEQGEQMASATLTEQADCLQALGRLDEAVEKYKERIKRGEKLKDFRGVATGKGQLATVLMNQGKYPEALAAHEEARAIFEKQNETAMVAVAWHLIGMVHDESGNYDKAETAYRKSLEIKTRNNDLAGQASSLGQLGYFYNYKLGRPEEAITFYRQAADIFIKIGDLRYEGVARSNIADTLFKLKRYDEARTEIQRAIECKRQIGIAAEPWKSFFILHNIETATGNPAAARTAWQQARDAYLAYREQGGYAQMHGGKLVDAVLSLLGQQKVDDVNSLFDQLTNDPDTPISSKLLIQAIPAILTGSRDPTVADNMEPNFADAAEILLLISRLAKK